MERCFFFMTCVFVICSLCFDCMQLDNVTPEIVDALNGVWDKQLSMLDWDEASAEEAKSPLICSMVVMCAYVVCQHLACVFKFDVLQ